MSDKKKSSLHPKNKHAGQYNFKELTLAFPALKQYVFTNQYQTETIDFSKPAAVKALNTAILHLHYKVEFWDIPQNYLCPPIPGRADYIHYIADKVLANKSRDEKITCLDVGVGANCIYPIIGAHEYNWNFVGSEIDEAAIAAAQNILDKNPKLKNKVELRLQTNETNILRGIIKRGEHFNIVICNPPFHPSAEAAALGSTRKIKNLHGKQVKQAVLNFGGTNKELWCDGGEVGFVMRMIGESARFSENCDLFTSLISKKDNLPPLMRKLKRVGATYIKTIEMEQGNKISRILTWSFND